MQENGAQMPERMSVERVEKRWKIKNLKRQKQVHEQETDDALEQVSAFVLSKAIKAPDNPENRRTDAQSDVHFHVVLIIDFVEKQVTGMIESKWPDQQ